MNFSSIPANSILGAALRYPLRWFPRGRGVPVFQGPLRGKNWIVGSTTHGCWLGSYEYVCVNQSRGEYFSILSNDDLLLASYASRLAAKLKSYPSAAFSYCAAQLIDENGREIGIEPHIGGGFLRKGSDEVKRGIRGAGCVLPSMMIRRDCYERVGAFGSWGVVGNWDLELRFLRTGDVAYHDEVLVKYRIWSTHERESRINLQLQEIVRLYETMVSDLVKSYPRAMRMAVIVARRHWACSGGIGIGRLCGTPKFEKAGAWS